LKAQSLEKSYTGLALHPQRQTHIRYPLSAIR
jgi:hypothetical protein